MRIALYHFLGPGGALRVVREQLQNAASDITYDLYESQEALAARSGALDFAIEALCERHVVVPRYPAVPRGAKRWAGLVARERHNRAVAALIEAGGYDVVSVHPDALTHTPGVLRHLKATAVYFMQEPPRSLYEAEARRLRFGGPTRRLPRQVLKTADMQTYLAAQRLLDQRTVERPFTIACNSLFSRESILRAYGRDAELCYLGVDTQRFVPGGRRAEEDYVLAVGGVEQLKRHELAVEAVGELPLGRRPQLRIIGPRGSDARRSALSRRAAELGVELEHLTSISDAELAEQYVGARATLCLARLEPFGLTTLESLACGTPVVAVNEGGFREVIRDGVNGVLVDGTAASVAGGIRRVEESRFEPEQLRQFVLDGEWTWRDAIGRLESILRSAAQQSAGRAP